MIFTVFDVETNGQSKYSDILEAGYIQINENLEILRHGSLYFWRDDWKINWQAQQIHKLQQGFLEEACPDQATFNGNLVRLYTLFNRSQLIGKNSFRFDEPCIEYFLQRYIKGIPIPEPDGQLDLQDIFVDKFRKWYGEKYGVSAGRKLGKLDELIEVIGLSQDEVQKMYREELGMNSRGEYHCAEYDAYMTYILLKYAVDKMGIEICK